jgi:hypothetical protein
MADPRIKELAYDALAATLGAPVDLFAAALRPLGYQTQPVLGSQFIRQRLPQRETPAIPSPIPEFTRATMASEIPQVDEFGRVIRQAQTPERRFTPMERVVGAAETAESVLRGVAGLPVAVVGSTIQGIREGDIPGERFGERMSSILQNLGYTPKTEAGREMLGQTGKLFERLETEYKIPPIGGAPSAAPLLGVRGVPAQVTTSVAEELATPPRGAIGPIDLARDMTPKVAGATAQAGPNVVSTRLPTAVKATEDPMSGELLSDFSTMKRDPAAFEQNVNLVREYPNFVSKARNPEKRAEDFIEQVKDNLVYLYDQVPEETRNRSKLWYDGARNIVDRWGNEYGQPDQALAGVLAVLSPQKDWFMNVSLGNRVVDIALNQRGFKWDSAMDDMAKQIWKDPKYDSVLDLVRGKRYEELQSPAEKALWLRTYDQSFNAPDHRIVTPEGDFADVRLTQSGKPYRVAWGSLNEIGKAVSILDNPSLENISTMLGSQHKVRNFYNNIYAPGDPRGHVTIDTHAVAAGLLRPLSGNSKEVLHNFGSNIKGERGPANSSVTGAQGTYGIYAEAYRRAAQERGVLPREMQSITWEAVRGLFPDTYKTPKNAQTIDNIWLNYKKGKMSLQEARDAVVRAAGGINPPEWQRDGLRGGAAD